MTIKEYLQKNKIEPAISGNELVIWCPICKKTNLLSGDRIATFHIDQETGDGRCEDCHEKNNIAEVAIILGLKPIIAGVSSGEVELPPKEYVERNDEINMGEAPVAQDEKIDISQFKPLGLKELTDILGLTIKKDDTNKLITFLCELSAYTENSQFNISFNAPSSTGKSYIPTEIANIFPKEDVIEIGYCSPTAFYHDVGEYDKEQKGYLVDLSRKILIFLDQPHTQLLERLRPLLSHDKKEIKIKITDKSQKHGLKTKNVFLRGFPSVIFCTAGLKIDEQEATRFLLLSPEINQEKIRYAIHEKIRKESDNGSYREWLNSNPERSALKERIMAIKQENITEIKMISPEKIEQRFMEKNKISKPRHTRDLGRISSLIKSLALLNIWFRNREGSIAVANETDIEEAFGIWESISYSQELNLPPYIYNLFQEVILPAWEEKNKGKDGIAVKELGLTRKDVIKKHYDVYSRYLGEAILRQQVLPMLEAAGLIMQEPDPIDKRKMLIYPTTPTNVSTDKNNSEGTVG